MVIKKDIFPGFDESMRYSEDFDLFIKLCFYGKVYYDASVLTILGRRQGTSGGLSGNKLKMRLGELRAYFNSYKRKEIGSIFLVFLLFWSIMKHCQRLFFK